jgi:hypothetical protein
MDVVIDTARALSDAAGFSPGEYDANAIPVVLDYLLRSYEAAAGDLKVKDMQDTIIERARLEELYRKFDELAQSIADNPVFGLADDVEKLFGGILSEEERERINGQVARDRELTEWSHFITLNQALCPARRLPNNLSESRASRSPHARNAIWE